jgi:hypothetical protein
MKISVALPMYHLFIMMGRNSDLDERLRAMQEFVGIRQDPAGSPDAMEYVRSLRQGDRLDRLGEA